MCLQARQQVQEGESSNAQLKQQLAQAQHSGRGQEALAEKLRERLADRIQAEDRRTRRDAEAYARLQRAISVAKGEANAWMLGAGWCALESICEPSDPGPTWQRAGATAAA